MESGKLKLRFLRFGRNDNEESRNDKEGAGMTRWIYDLRMTIYEFGELNAEAKGRFSRITQSYKDN